MSINQVHKLKRSPKERDLRPRALGVALLLHLALFLLLPWHSATQATPAPALELHLIQPPAPEAVAKRSAPETRAGPAARSAKGPSARSTSQTPKAGATRPGAVHVPTRSLARTKPKPLDSPQPQTLARTKPRPKNDNAPSPTAPDPLPTHLVTKTAPSSEIVQGRPTLDLFPKALFTELASGGEPAPALGEEGRILARIDGYVAELQAHDRVRVGLVDPYFGRLGRAMEQHFKPSWSTLGEKLGAPGVGGALRAFAQDYLATAKRYGLRGSPYHAGERDSALYRGHGAPDTQVAGQLGPAGSLEQASGLMDLWRDSVHGRAGGFELLALVRVTQSPDGGLLDVRLELGSGKRAYDHLALESARATLHEPLPPLRRGSGLGLSGNTIVSLWAFKTRFNVVPPAWGLAGSGLGVASLSGCDITSDGELGQCFTPLQRLAWPKLKLIAVY